MEEKKLSASPELDKAKKSEKMWQLIAIIALIIVVALGYAYITTAAKLKECEDGGPPPTPTP